MTDGFQVRSKFTCGTRLPEDSRKCSCPEVAAADALSGKLGLKCKSVALQAEDLSMSGYSKERNSPSVQALRKWVFSQPLLGLGWLKLHSMTYSAG